MAWTLLLLGLVVLFILLQQQSARLARLEREFEALREGAAPLSEPAGEARPPPPVSLRAAPLPEQRGPVEPEAVPVPARPSAEEPPSAPAVQETLAILFERFVGGRLLIWIGGIALAVAGLFLVRYSIEIGLVTPPVRMMMAAAFGILLLLAGEFARSRPGSALDPRVAQALVGAGILVLYATPYGSLVLYQLISMATASALMVMVTAVALVLSLRHGAPTAVLGLAGGFATPLLVGDPDAGAVPLLTYLGLLDIAILTIARRCGWTWLAAGAVLLSFGWTGWLTVAPVDDALAGGLFVVVLAVAASLVRIGEGRQLRFLRPAGLGLLQLALLVARTDIGPAAWGLFGALAAASILLSGRRPEYRPLPAFALALALVLLTAKAVDLDPLAPYVAAGITLLFGAAALPGALRSRAPTMWTGIACAAFAGPAIILRLARPELLERPVWGGLMILLALVPAWLAWSRREAAGTRKWDEPLFIAAAAALLLLGIAAYDLLPPELLAAAWLVLAAAAALSARKVGDPGLSLLALLVAGIAILWAVDGVPGLWATAALSLMGMPALASGLPAPSDTLRLLVLPAPLLFAAWHWLPEDFRWPRRALLAAAGLFLVAAAYVFFKQVFGLSSEADFIARGFAERLIVTQALFVAGWLLGRRWVRLPWLDEGQIRLIGTLLTALAAARLFWFDMLLHNPALDTQRVGEMPLLNLLAPAYLLSAFWLYSARRRAASEALSGLWLALFLAALILGVMLMVRQLFQGAILTGPGLPTSEFYGYSLAGLSLSIALLISGIRLPDKALRLAGLVLLTATILKVFLVDAGELEGILRILSFLGLGIALIGIGKLYTRVLNAEAGGG
jgi:uncharacterized membrane protein